MGMEAHLIHRELGKVVEGVDSDPTQARPYPWILPPTAPMENGYGGTFDPLQAGQSCRWGRPGPNPGPTLPLDPFPDRLDGKWVWRHDRGLVSLVKLLGEVWWT